MKTRFYAYGPVDAWGSIVESGKKFIGLAKTRLLRRPLQGMPVRNTLTRIRLSPHKVRGTRGAAERCAEPARFASTTVGREHVHHGLGV